MPAVQIRCWQCQSTYHVNHLDTSYLYLHFSAYCYACLSRITCRLSPKMFYNVVRGTQRAIVLKSRKEG